jgi:hypothetical protein
MIVGLFAFLAEFHHGVDLFEEVWSLLVEDLVDEQIALVQLADAVYILI